MSFVTAKTQDLHNHILTVMTKFTHITAIPTRKEMAHVMCCFCDQR